MTTQVSPPQRRKFLFTMLGGLGAMLGAASAWPVFRFLASRSRQRMRPFWWRRASSTLAANPP